MSENVLLLNIQGLHVAYAAGPKATREVVHGVSLSLAAGETLALVGQSGSGKTTIARAVSGLLPAGAGITAGTVKVAGHEVSGFKPQDWRSLRGTVIGYVPQDPLSSLDPLQRIGAALIEALKVGRPSLGREAAEAAAVALLERVGIHAARDRLRSYPHELSGGQLQRVLIAVAIAAEPQFLIADEPTSALDVTVQKVILDLIDELRVERGLGVLFITHDLALAAERSDHLAVLKDGRLVEHRAVNEVLERPDHEYTEGLLSHVPAADPDKFAAHLGLIAAGGSAGGDVRGDGAGPGHAAEPVVSVRGVSKTFPGRTAREEPVVALSGVDLRVEAGAVHAIVGESGSGKTTLGRIIAGLGGFDTGQVLVQGRELPRVPATRNVRPQDLQLVYQNSLAALDPRLSVEAAVAEPLVLARRGSKAQRAAAVREALDAVALPLSVLDRKPLQLSGGQRQRVALARALVLAPRVLVLDEPTSALDVSVQAQVIELLFDLKAQRELSYVVISHDLGLVRQIASHVSVLERGRIVESGPSRELFGEPEHEYTRALIEAVPGGGLLATV
ncbi:MAG: ABC transporter ATP-binding protein [Arthrobacter sp.]|jgi:peptide/nickel transport system ATP-binding protein|nr:ABC transporter ATP-binding protein [Arthrobacter sp.]